MNKLASTALCALAIFAAGYLLRGCVDRPPLDVGAQVDTVRINVSRFDASEAVRLAADSASAAALARSAAVRSRLLLRADSASAAADSTRLVLDSIQAEADSIRRLAQALDDTRQHVADSLRAVIDGFAQEQALLREQFIRADSAARHAGLLLHDALRRLEIVAARARGRCGLGVGGGFGILSRRGDLFVGFSCHL